MLLDAYVLSPRISVPSLRSFKMGDTYLHSVLLDIHEGKIPLGSTSRKLGQCRAPDLNNGFYMAGDFDMCWRPGCPC